MANKLCNVCGMRRVGSGGQQYDTQAAADNGLCGPCDEEGGWENTHSDYGHEGNPEAEYTEGCWICHPELNVAQQKPTSKAGKPGHHSPRRKQLNHRTQCTHPQTPAERRKCREAFWQAEQGKGGKGK